MKIVIAAWHLKNPTVGLGRYCRELVEALGRLDDANQYEILMPEPRHPFPSRANVRYRSIRFPLFRRRFWEQAAPLFAGSHDLLHLPYDSCLAWKRGKLIATIHDAKPFLFPELRPKRNLSHRIERLIVGDPRKKLDHVITISDSSRRDLMRHMRLAEGRITAVPCGIDSTKFHPLPAGRKPAEKPYVMSVAGADPTKNIVALVEAFAALPAPLRQTHDLVLAGDVAKRQDVRHAIERAGITAQTKLLGVVPDEALIHWYQRALLFVFPSLYEGFGLPVLEAMACGIPVICSDSSSLPEVTGDAALLIDPRDITQLSAAITRLLDDPALRRELRDRGRARALTFSWDRTAARTVGVYRQVLADRSVEAGNDVNGAAERIIS